MHKERAKRRRDVRSDVDFRFTALFYDALWSRMTSHGEREGGGGERVAATRIPDSRSGISNALLSPTEFPDTSAIETSLQRNLNQLIPAYPAR